LALSRRIAPLKFLVQFFHLLLSIAGTLEAPKETFTHAHRDEPLI